MDFKAVPNLHYYKHATRAFLHAVPQAKCVFPKVFGYHMEDYIQAVPIL